MMVTMKWGIKYIGYIIESDLIHLKLTHIYWMESSHTIRMAMLKKKIKIDMMTPSLIEDWKLWHVVQRKSTQATQLQFSFDLELIGMLYY